MPTPDESAAIPPTPPIEPTSSRNSFASCPPEDIREPHPRHETRDSPTSAASEPAEAPGEGEELDHAIMQEPTPGPDSLDGILERQVAREEHEKGEHVEDAGMVAELPSPGASPDAQSDSDVRLAQSMASAGLEGSSAERPEGAARFMYDPEMSKDRLSPHAQTSFLKPGSKFRGTQQSDRQVYDVQVEIKDVDLTESFLCGYLRIQGLTDDHPTLTTFFEGEIIGPKHLFRTTNPTWNSSEKVDLQHWARFPAWRPLARAAKAYPATFTLKNHLARDHLFMRWKEYFLVPDHRVKSISGASFEGFYYICFDQRQGSVSGIYFHAKSEKYQQLELRHVDDGGLQPAVEFR